MEGVSDDEIEVVKLSSGDEKWNKDIAVPLEYDPLWNFNPLSSNRSSSLFTDSINPGSIHALQTAFASLQRKYNDRERCYAEMVHKYKAMKKSIMDAKTNECSCFEIADDAFVQELPSVIYATAGTSENESALAENWATKGLIQHLRTECFRGKNECSRLKKLVDNLEIEKTTKLGQLELFQAEVENLSVSLTQHKKEIEQLRSYVKDLESDNIKLKQKIGEYENGSIFRDSEIQDLKSKLANVENERKSFAEQCQDSQKKMLLSDREVKTLEVQCKQYEIQIEILKDQRQTDDCDDVDGDIKALSKCLEMIQMQKKVISELKGHTLTERAFLEQAGLFAGKLRTMKNTEIREEAVGSSFHQKFDEHSNIPIYENLAGCYPGNQLNKASVEVTHRQQDHGTYQTIEDSGVMSGHRSQGYIIPTGIQNVPNMIAKEVSNVAIKRDMASNTFCINLAGAKTTKAQDLKNLSRNLNVKEMYKSPSAPGLLQPSNTPYAANIITNSRNQISQNASTVYQVSSGSTIVGKESPRNGNTAVLRAQPSATTYQKNAPQYIVPPNYANLQYNNRPIASPRGLTPDRITNSEIISWSKPSENVAMLSSVLSPLEMSFKKPDEIMNNKIYGHVTPSNISDPRHTYVNVIKEEIHEPDYENVYVASHQESSRSIEENEDISNQTPIHSNKSRPVSALPSQEQGCGANVSALKICPACNLEFSRLSMTDFQRHVCECFEHCDESPKTMQDHGSNDDRTCPVCQALFPLTVSQVTYEQHVLAHFGDEPMMGNFECVP